MFQQNTCHGVVPISLVEKTEKLYLYFDIKEIIFLLHRACIRYCFLYSKVTVKCAECICTLETSKHSYHINTACNFAS